MTRLWVLRSLLLVADVALIEGLFYATYAARFKSGLFTNPVPFSAAELVLPSAIVLCYWLLIFSVFGLYRYDPLRQRRRILHDALRAAGFGALILFILTFNPQDPLPSSRVILATYAAGLILIVTGNRVALSTILRDLRIRGIGTWRTLLVGSRNEAIAVARYVRAHPELGFRIAGCLGAADSGAAPVPIIGNFADFRRRVAADRIQTVLFATEPTEAQALFRLMRILRGARVRSFISPNLYPLLIGEVRPAALHGHPLIELRPELLSWTEQRFKRLFDIAASACLLILSLPVWLLLLVAIPLNSRGPVFFVQQRVGLNGRVFPLLKFRSMFQNAEARTGAVLAVERDPRITAVGRFIRATRLDELPQLLNVLVGQMSLVGPRPERIEFVRRFLREIPLYERRLNVKPGLTGWSQVHLKYDSGTEQIPLKLTYDFYYIENMSLPLDAKILFMTLFVMLRGEGV
ncbi:sugar transferase [candidate division KSB1 bacterium]|nr:sugar transferase [candidate division KSB1 bacterium]